MCCPAGNQPGVPDPLSNINQISKLFLIPMQKYPIWIKTMDESRNWYRVSLKTYYVWSRAQIRSPPHLIHAKVRSFLLVFIPLVFLIKELQPFGRIVLCFVVGLCYYYYGLAYSSSILFTIINSFCSQFC